MEVTVKDNVSNGGAVAIGVQNEYVAEVTIQGICPILFHRWNCEEVEAKSNAAKGSKAKKTDNLESYVYRTQEGNLGIPGEYLKGAIVASAKSLQDPRSPRKCAKALFKAAVISLTERADLGVSAWDFEHKCRAIIQGNAITRVRPALNKGWKATFQFLVAAPEYISPEMLNDRIQYAGRLVGLADFRPSYGRFQVVKFEITHV